MRLKGNKENTNCIQDTAPPRMKNASEESRREEDEANQNQILKMLGQCDVTVDGINSSDHFRDDCIINSDEKWFSRDVFKYIKPFVRKYASESRSNESNPDLSVNIVYDRYQNFSSPNQRKVFSNLGVDFARKSSFYRNVCMLSVVLAFGIGLLLGVLIPLVYLSSNDSNASNVQVQTTSFNKTYLHTRLGDLKYKPTVNTTEDRVFLPNKRDNTRDGSPRFPTIEDFKGHNNYILDKPKRETVKLNKPTLYSRVTFVNDESRDKNENKEMQKENHGVLLKYLGSNISNKTASLLAELGEDILAGSEFDGSNVNTKSMHRGEENSDAVSVIVDKIYWGSRVEEALPMGFRQESTRRWVDYVKTSSAVKMELGCGRMQNRLVTFLDGRQACVRYRQNTDQIQGEIFSFYLAQVLRLPNLAPSLVHIVNLTDNLWQSVASDIASAQWGSNRPVVMTEYIPNLESAHIPPIFKPSKRHLNRNDIMGILHEGPANAEEKNTKHFLIANPHRKKIPEETNYINDEINENDELLSLQDTDAVVNNKKIPISDKLLDKFVELAQWSDLIIFDYLTANLDRIVNNLYNYQWNVNIMDAPAHNLARKIDSNLLLFLDNESGLLHGYRLLSKYEMYHTLLLDNLCVFRKSTAEAIVRLYTSGDVGDTLNKMFKERNNSGVLDVLPPLPEKSIKILNERLSKIVSQIKRCEEQFAL